VLSEAIRQVANLRGRLGAFQKNILETNVNSLSVALENVTASESAIRDADFAAETAALTRAQILVQANTSVLAQANSAPQNVLALLRG
jgi:flagellin